MLAGCGPSGFLGRLFARRHEAPPPAVHFVVGDPYQAGGIWRYPRVQFDSDETGLATVAGAHGPYTADGERFDQTAMAAAHRTLQLPAIARVTNLDTGLSAVVRINDRGPAAPARLIELTRRAAQLIQAGDGSRVRVQVLEGESRRLAADLQGDGPRLDLARAPTATVTAEALPPPPGTVASNRGRIAPSGLVQRPAESTAPTPVPLRLPEEVSQGPATGGLLYVDAGSFSRTEYARILQQRLASLGAQVTTSYDAPRDRAYAVRIGPFTAVPDADAALDRTLRAGVTDARIIVAP